MADKLDTIRKLLTKAERAGSPEEAEAYRGKATDLMLRYAIDEAMLGDGKPRAEEIVIERIPLSTYAQQRVTLLTAVGKPFGCRAVRLTTRQRGRPTTNAAELFGFASDVEAVKVLYSSLVVQMVREGDMARRLRPDLNGKAFLVSFYVGFANTVYQRLVAQRERVVEESSTGADLVLVDRSKLVEDRVADQYENLRMQRPSISTASAFHAGTAAGRRADLGNNSLGGSRTAALHG